MYAEAIALLLSKNIVTLNQVMLFLTKRKLLTLLPEILSFLKRIQKEEKQRESLVLISPFEVDITAISAIKTLLKIEEVDLVKQVLQKDLLSGFKAIYKGKSYDTSGKRIINELITK